MTNEMLAILLHGVRCRNVPCDSGTDVFEQKTYVCMYTANNREGLMRKSRRLKAR